MDVDDEHGGEDSKRRRGRGRRVGPGGVTLAGMIRHLSISAADPAHVAAVLAELMRGRVRAFPPRAGSFVVVVDDGAGTAVEVYPAGTELVLGDDGVRFAFNPQASPHTSTHAALSVPTSEAEIAAIAGREGWWARRRDRGPFELIELWVENRLMLELFPPELEPRWAERERAVS